MSEQATASRRSVSQPFTAERFAQIRATYETSGRLVGDIASEFKITPTHLIMMARAYMWKRVTPVRKPAAANNSAPLPGWKRALATPAKKPRKVISFAIPEARAYDAPTLAAITTLQRRGFVVYQCEPGLFMVGTRRLDMAGMMAKAVRYGYDAAAVRGGR